MILPNPQVGAAQASVCAAAGFTTKCEGVPSLPGYGYGYYPPGMYGGMPGYPTQAGAGIPVRTNP